MDTLFYEINMKLWKFYLHLITASVNSTFITSSTFDIITEKSGWLYVRVFQTAYIYKGKQLSKVN